MEKFIIALSILLASCAKDSGTTPEAGPKPWDPIEGKYAIIIGDSISEGHPALHGRLHPFQGASWGIDVDLNHQNEPGQLAYELEHRLGIRFVNQGIGGQTSHMIWRGRWSQDVHPKSETNPDSTLPYDYAPSLIYIHVGINDIATSDNYDQMHDAIQGMIDDANTIGAQVIIDTVGPDDADFWTDHKIDMLNKINAYIKSLDTGDGKVIAVDYMDWASNGTGEHRTLKQGMFADDVHPTKDGYIDFAKYAYESIKNRVSF